MFFACSRELVNLTHSRSTNSYKIATINHFLAKFQNSLTEKYLEMSVSIQVAVRCRPFVCDDELGVSMFQNSEVEGGNQPSAF